MPKPESVLENETHRILWDLEIQMDHPIPARRPSANKQGKNSSCRFYYSSGPEFKDKRKQKDKLLRTKITVEYIGDSDTNCNCRLWNGTQM